MSHPPHFLALDVGTTSVKAAVFDTTGELRGRAREELTLHHPRPLWAEVDANDWWAAACRLIPMALAAAGIAPTQLAAIGVSGLMHALTPVDARGEPLDRTMLWMDQRSAPQCAELQARWSDHLTERVGRPLTTMAAATKLRWLQQHRPEVIERAHNFLLAKDFLRLKLTGEMATDPSDAAGTYLVDRRTGQWSEDLLVDLLQLPPEKFPPIRPSTALAGCVTAEAARATGLVAGTPVAVGAGDVQSTLVGLNLYVPGRACAYLGTAAWIMRALPPEGDELRCEWFGNTATLGAGLKWLREVVTGEVTEETWPYYQMEAEAGTAPPGADGVIFLPHLMGERGHRPHPHATGVFFGLTLAHRRRHLLRAVLEGNACLLRRCLEQAQAPPLDPLILAGGGAQSRLWRQIIASVLGQPVQVPRVTESTALGAALIAAVATGHFPSRRAAAASVRLGGREEPRAEWRETYEALYRRFCELEEAMEPFYHDLP